MKKILLSALFCLIAGASLSAKGLDFQIGAGYSGDFYESDSLPYGFAAYAGVGYKFFPTLSVGAEYEYAQTYSSDSGIPDTSLSLRHHAPKAYLKFNALKIVTISGLAGLDISTPIVDSVKGDTETNFTAGARVSVLFAYAQYMATFADEVSHRYSLGVVFNK